MGIMAESMVAYAQPLLDETDGSQAQLQNAFSIAQMCWSLALLPEKEQRDSLKKMQSALKMDADEFAAFCESIIVPMIRRHREMFPNMSRTATEGILPGTRKKKYPKTGRNKPCPCGSGKKYKRCCGK